MSRAIDERADFSIIRYANCWEDADVLLAALRPAAGKRILSIASAGDNALALVGEGADVVAADLSPAQLACLELRVAAFRRLEYEELLGFLGVRPAKDRTGVYRRLAGDLSEPARRFWDSHGPAIAAGIVSGGRFEGYFRAFRTKILPWIHGRKTVAALLAEKDETSRNTFYEQTWDTWQWRFLFRVFFSRFMMGRLGRDPEFFRYVEGSVAERILQRTRYALTALPTHANPYLAAILTGGYGAALPRYLRPEHFAPIRAGLDRLQLFQGSIEKAAEAHGSGGFDGYNLSDIFEYLDPDACRAIYRVLIDRARPGARLVFWNMLVPWQAPAELAGRVRSLEKEAAELFARDMAFFYSRLVIEEVC